ncbi:MAG: fructosamine kinase family protein [Actinomycetota bacterium]|nr:fructosamine kinase family protein [Actinomycetota bacterium]
MQSDLRAHVAGLLGVAPTTSTTLRGGDVGDAARVELADGRSVFVKTRAGAPPDFFGVEARGLSWLAEAGGVPTPDVLGADDVCLVLQWLEPGRPDRAAAERFGRELAATHAAGADSFGAEQDGYIGRQPLPNPVAAGWVDFYAQQRIEPYLRAARDHGHIRSADVRAVQGVLARLDDLAGPAEPPARLHGDLWAGNVMWLAGGGCALIDPAAHGGHRETDLAMLALFGLPHLDTVLAAYHETTPLADGWHRRIPLHQLHPLLVHAVTHGPSYGVAAGAAAREAMAA